MFPCCLSLFSMLLALLSCLSVVIAPSSDFQLEDDWLARPWRLPAVGSAILLRCRASFDCPLAPADERRVEHRDLFFVFRVAWLTGEL